MAWNLLTVPSFTTLKETFWSNKTSAIKKYVEEKKVEILAAARLESTTVHPDASAYSMQCPITMELINEAVITAEGNVYEKSSICNALKEDPRDPQTRKPLKIEELFPFPELASPIAVFIARQKTLQHAKKQLLKEASAIIFGKSLQLNAALFLCPINQKIIRTPVITQNGKIYDKQSLLENNNLDENGLLLPANEYEAFPEFFELIKTYKFYCNKHEKQLNTKKSSTQPDSNLLVGYLTALSCIFSKDEAGTQDENECGIKRRQGC